MSLIVGAFLLIAELCGANVSIGTWIFASVLLLCECGLDFTIDRKEQP